MFPGEANNFPVTVSGVVNSITISPFSASGNFVFSPSSYTFTSANEADTAIFVATAQSYLDYVDYAIIEYVISGADAPLFTEPGITYIYYSQRMFITLVPYEFC